MLFQCLDVEVEDTSAPKGCPNKINPFHECTEYCYEKYNEPRKVSYIRKCVLQHMIVCRSQKLTLMKLLET